MRLLARYRRIPKWVRWLVGLHLAFFLFVVLVWGVAEYTRRDIASKVLLLSGQVTDAERLKLRNELYFAGYAWDGSLGPLVRLNHRTEKFSFFMEWSPLKHNIVSVAQSRDGLRANRTGSKVPAALLVFTGGQRIVDTDNGQMILTPRSDGTTTMIPISGNPAIRAISIQFDP